MISLLVASWRYTVSGMTSFNDNDNDDDSAAAAAAADDDDVNPALQT